MKARQIRDSVVYRMGQLRGVLLERIKQADTLLGHADKLEALACKGADTEGVEAALDGLEALAGVGAKGKRANEKESETG